MSEEEILKAIQKLQGDRPHFDVWIGNLFKTLAVAGIIGVATFTYQSKEELSLLRTELSELRIYVKHTTSTIQDHENRLRNLERVLPK